MNKIEKFREILKNPLERQKLFSKWQEGEVKQSLIVDVLLKKSDKKKAKAQEK